MTTLDFAETLEVLHRWLGQEVQLWVHCGGESILFVDGRLKSGQNLPRRIDKDEATTNREVLVFELENPDGRTGFFLGREGFLAEEHGTHGLLIHQPGAVELQLAVRGPRPPDPFA
jgi:hypothetical protein